jgi:hypothetical protein
VFERGRTEKEKSRDGMKGRKEGRLALAKGSIENNTLPIAIYIYIYRRTCLSFGAC